jgi:hypothetical protein
MLVILDVTEMIMQQNSVLTPKKEFRKSDISKIIAKVYMNNIKVVAKTVQSKEFCEAKSTSAI